MGGVEAVGRTKVAGRAKAEVGVEVVSGVEVEGRIKVGSIANVVRGTDCEAGLVGVAKVGDTDKTGVVG